MNFQWFLSPMVMYGAVAMALVLTLIFFLSMKVALAKVERRVRKAGSSTTSDIQTLAADVEKLRETVANIEQESFAAPVGPAINLTRRTQVLKMHQRGEALPTIAAALRVPQTEIELLLKLHRLVNTAS